VIRDIIDLHAVGRTFSYIDLERLARREYVCITTYGL